MRDETDDIDWSGSEKAAAVGSDALGQRLEKLAKLWEPKDEGVMNIAEGVDLSPGGADTPEGKLKAGFDKAAINPEEVPSKATGDDRAGEVPPTEPWARIKYDLEQNANQKPAVDPLAEKMKAAGWAPKESAKPPDWEELQRNLQHAQDTANATRLGQQSFAAVSGFHADPNAGSAEIAAAKAPLEVAQERQAFEAKQREADAHLLSQRQQMAQRDPTSPESVRARARVKALYADTGKLPPDFESYTAADVAPLMSALPAIEKNQSEDKRTEAKTAAEARAKAEADADRDRQFGLNEKKYAEEARSRGVSEAEIARHHRVDEANQARLAGAVSAVAPGDYSKIPENVRGTVRDIVEHRAPAPPPGSRFGQGLLNYVTQVDPNFDASAYGRYQDVAKQLAEDPSIHSALTAKEHFKRALSNIPNNFDTQGLNRVANALKTGSGSAGLSPFEADVTVGAGELSKGLGENAEAGKEAVKKLLDPNQSKEQIAAHLKELIYLQDEGLEMKRKKFESAAPKGMALPAILSREDEAGLKTPSGKPYARKQMNPQTKQVRYLDKAGNVVEVTGG